MNLRSSLRWARAQALDLLGLTRRALQRLDGSRAAVLMYHRVLPRAEALRNSVAPGMYVAPETFAHHLAWLEAHLRILPLGEVVDRLEKGRSLPPGACAITFDDGWRDNAEHALPELERRRVPATIFVVTERVGTLGAFWPDEVSRRMTALVRREQERLARSFGAPECGTPVDALIERWKRLSEQERRGALQALRDRTGGAPPENRELLDWPDLERLAAAGVDIEAHGASHAILEGLPTAEVERELGSALDTLRAHGLGRHQLLAYPNGDHDESVRRTARALGYRAAVTVECGYVDARTDPMAIPRVALHDDVSRTRVEFLARLAGGA